MPNYHWHITRKQVNGWGGLIIMDDLMPEYAKYSAKDAELFLRTLNKFKAWLDSSKGLRNTTDNHNTIKKHGGFVMKYKFVTTDNKAPFNKSHDFTKHIASGQFRSVKGDLMLCKTGFHVADETTLLNWFQIGDLYEVSVKGDNLTASDKTVHRSLRFDRKIGTVTPEIVVKIANWAAKRAKEFADSGHDSPAAKSAAQYAEAAARYDQYAARYDQYAARYAEAAARYAKSAAKYAARYAQAAAAQYDQYAESFNAEWTTELIRLIEESNV